MDHRAVREKIERERSGQTSPPLKAMSSVRHFVGKMDYPWVRLASALPGKALHVGVGIWYMAGLKKASFESPFPFSISRVAKDFKLPQTTARRGFKTLELAGLISVEGEIGRKRLVKLLDPLKGSLHSGISRDNRSRQAFFENVSNEDTSSLKVGEGGV